MTIDDVVTKTAITLGLAIWFVDVGLNARPSGVEPWGWRLFAIFVPTILGLMLRPLPGGVVVLLGITLVILFEAVPIPEKTEAKDRTKEVFKKALAGYADSSVWMMLTAYFMARALIKTGLARRIDKDLSAVSVGTPADIEAFLKTL